MSIGFIKLHRKLTEWEWYSDINATRLFVHLLITCNYEDKRWKGIVVKRGQRIFSLGKLAQEINISVQALRTSINKLKSTSELTSESTSSYSVLELTNYGVYQDKNNESNKQNNTLSNKPTTSEQQTNNKPTTTTKEVKKERKEEDKKEITTPKKPKYNDFQFQIAEQLGNHIKNIKNINLTVGNIKKWAGDIRLLQEQDLKPRQDSQRDIIKAMQSVLDNTGKEYFPQIESGSSFRIKFIKIENYKQSTKTTKDQQHLDERAALAQHYANQQGES